MELQNDVGRSCGGCNACCKAFLVPEVGKIDGNWCQHCVIGIGCSIYDSRPTACREYACAWLNGLGDDDFRPDRLGVMVDVQDFRLHRRTVALLHLFEMRDGALANPYVQRLIEENKDQGLVVICHYQSGSTYRQDISMRRHLFTPGEVDTLRLLMTD